MPIVLARIDQRLIHGQVLASNALANNKINGIIFADKALSINPMEQDIYSCGAEAADVNFCKGKHFIDPDKLFTVLSALDTVNSRFLVLFKEPTSVLRAILGGLKLEYLNLGNYHTNSPIFKTICPGFKIGPEEEEDLQRLSEYIPFLYLGSLDFNNNPSRLYEPLKGKLCS
jgi:mannose/fructose/N-acetylgalactosamine-specific phosphotransferase system component IIB